MTHTLVVVKTYFLTVTFPGQFLSAKDCLQANLVFQATPARLLRLAMLRTMHTALPLNLLGRGVQQSLP